MKLRITPPEGEAWEVEFSGRALNIGRKSTCDVVLDEQNVSRFHAEVHLNADGEPSVRDLDSRYGTVLNGTELKDDKTFLPGDLLQVGGFQIEVLGDGANARATRPEMVAISATRKLKRSDHEELASMPTPLSLPLPLAPRPKSNSAWHYLWVLLLLLALAVLVLLFLRFTESPAEASPAPVVQELVEVQCPAWRNRV